MTPLADRSTGEQWPELDDDPPLFHCPKCGFTETLNLIGHALTASPSVPSIRCGSCSAEFAVQLHEVDEP